MTDTMRNKRIPILTAAHNEPVSSCGKRSLIHRYQNNGYNIVLDINSGCIHVVDEVTYEVLPYMEEECDRMEYDGSMMYDEYPDRLQLRLMCRRIYDKAEKEEENPGAWLMDLLEGMTYQELCRRRVEHREIRKKIY